MHNSDMLFIDRHLPDNKDWIQNCARNVLSRDPRHRKSLWVVASDDVMVRRYFQKIVGQQTLVMDLTPVHVAYMDTIAEPGLNDPLGQTLAEWYVLGGADIYVQSRSGYSETAVRLINFWI